MKKIFLIIAIIAISILFLVGCNLKQDVQNIEEDNSINEVDNQINEEIDNEINNNAEINVELENEELNNEFDEENNEENELIDVKNQTIKKIDEANGLITNNIYMVNWGIDEEQWEGNVFSLNIDSEDAKKFNSDFQETMKEQINNDSNFSVNRAQYYINGNILSIIESVNSEWGGKHLINTYNFDLSTGKKLNTEEILKNINISKDDFMQKLPELYTAAFLSQGPHEYEDDEHKQAWTKVEDIEMDWVRGIYDTTISAIPNNINEIPVYLDNEGNLHILAAVQLIAGSCGIELVDVKFENAQVNLYM